MKRHLAPVLVAAFAVTLLAGCSASVDIGEQSISSEELATQVTTALAENMQVDVDQVPTITCPEDLEAKVGASTTCLLMDDTSGKDYDVAVKVTSIDGSKALFSVEVAAEPRPASTE
ncbi:MAG: DUF4333 domain-containing protein [Actinomycetota bacterium]|nr:DUF4333 domain-containing protein [Actinomycetota bacterium]MDP2287620.1 DUF4333 domain-containing protein [Actinomycetota bacterium]